MASRTPYPEAARELLRQTLFDAARHHLEERPWSEVTMGDIAATAGVSRQTLYKEFGNKSEFAVNLTIHEGERFLGAVEDAVRAHTDNPAAAIRAALELFLHRRRRPASPHGGHRRRLRRLLPFVTTQGMPVIVWATPAALGGDRGRLAAGGESRREAARRGLVRLAISYIINPLGVARSTAASVADLLGPFIDRALGHGPRYWLTIAHLGPGLQRAHRAAQHGARPQYPVDGGQRPMDLAVGGIDDDPHDRKRTAGGRRGQPGALHVDRDRARGREAPARVSDYQAPRRGDHSDAGPQTSADELSD